MSNDADHAGAGPPDAQFAPASREAADALPWRVVARGDAAGWTSLFVSVTSDDETGTVEFETRPTGDQWLAVTAGGQHEVECYSGGAWRRAVKPAGSAGLSPGGMADRLRVRPLGGEPMRLVHVYLPQRLLAEVADAYARAGVACRPDALNALAFTDPAVTHAALGLVDAIRGGAPDLYAQATGQFLATHLLSRYGHRRAHFDAARTPAVLTARRLARVVEYMSAHFAEPLTLERLAAEAGVSKFHFARLFRAATGEAPHRFLTRLRMDAARQMLRDTGLTVAEVAAAAGYASGAQFGAAFARHVGRTPVEFRANARR